MTLEKLIHSTNTTNLIEKIGEIFPREKDFLAAYEWMLIKLKKTETTNKRKNIIIVVYPAVDIFSKEKSSSHNEVCGYSIKENKTYDIKLCNYAEWLGMEISKDSLNYYGKEIVLAHILRDMSFYGFEDIQTRDFIDDIEEPLNKAEVNKETFEMSILTDKMENEKNEIEEVIKENRKSFCAMLGIKDIDSVSFFANDSFL